MELLDILTIGDLVHQQETAHKFVATKPTATTLSEGEGPVQKAVYGTVPPEGFAVAIPSHAPKQVSTVLDVVMVIVIV